MPLPDQHEGEDEQKVTDVIRPDPVPQVLPVKTASTVVEVETHDEAQESPLAD